MPTEPADNRSKGTYALVTLGCPKNLVDSERMLGLLRSDGYRLVKQPEGADFVVVNTCGFIESARRESQEVIEEMIRLKQRGEIRGLIVAGCLAQRDKESLLGRYPEIDQLVGVFGREEIAAAADRLMSGPTEERTVFPAAPSRPPPDGDRLRITLRHLAFLKIAEGCDRLCTFCSIPMMRGSHASKPIAQVVAEAEELAADGVRELIVISQDTSYYGVDLYGQPRLAQLLERLDGIDGLEWIRLMYLYPMHIGEDVIDVMSAGRKILPYMDLPLQHVNDRVLRRMKRRVTRAESQRLLERLRRRIDGLVLRTTLISGFPGETDEEFDELLDFVRQGHFQRLGVLAYSREPGTHAAGLDGQLPEAVIQSRLDRLLAAQQPIAFAFNESRVGRRLDVIIDSYIPDEDNACVGRSQADAPEVDGVVYVSGERLVPGQIVPCEIVATDDYDLIAAAVGPPR